MATVRVLFLLLTLLQTGFSAPSIDSAPIGNTIHDYDFDIHESGTDFKERVTIDEDRNLEIIQVPSHNDVTGATFIHDFNLNVTLRREVDRGLCFLTDLSRSLEDGLQLKPHDMLTAIQSSKQRKTPGTVRSVSLKWMVGALVTSEERAAFGPEMRELCDGQTIHRLDRVDDSVNIHEAGFLPLPQRWKRQITGNQCPMSLLKSRCKVSIQNCAYIQYINCNQAPPDLNSRSYAQCIDDDTLHIIDQVLCCTPCCPDAAQATMLFPFCDTMTAAQVEAGTCF